MPLRPGTRLGSYEILSLLGAAGIGRAYGDERVSAQLFLPRNATPPYQVVIWFPGNDVFFLPAGEALASP